MAEFNAFADPQAISFADLTVESDETQLAIYGKLTLRADEGSRASLDHLIDVLSQAREGLAAAIARGDSAAPDPAPLPSVRNPFA
ncbi:MAG: hypothetical protein KGJ57_13475 [Sphingomonadales bacterium]|nr:hypothetical protein [Sphingomonadales bacterium]MDE2170423.1 hypothetical protein [Sphingomonadales bacterium]